MIYIVEWSGVESKVLGLKVSPRLVTSFRGASKLGQARNKGMNSGHVTRRDNCNEDVCLVQSLGGWDPDPHASLKPKQRGKSKKFRCEMGKSEMKSEKRKAKGERRTASGRKSK